MTSRTKKMLQAAMLVSKNSNTGERQINNDNVELGKHFDDKIITNDLFKTIMIQKSSPLVTNVKNSNESLETSEECSRDTEEWLPPHLRNISPSSLSSQNNLVQLDFQPTCSRELFPTFDHSVNRIQNNDLDNIENFIEPNLLDQSNFVNNAIINTVGVSGLRKAKKTNKKIVKHLKNNSGEGKSVKPIPCKVNCQNNCREKFSEEERQLIFNEYWSLKERSRKKDFILNCVVEENIVRKRVKGVSRRKLTRRYYMNLGSKRAAVCQQFLLKTLDITQRFCIYTLSEKSPIGTSKLEGRGRGRPPNITKDILMKNLDNFIQKLPAVTAHYCRASSSKKYLPAEFLNVQRLFMVYRKECEQNGEEHVGIKTFRFVFNTKYNIGFHLPKKDKCKFCTKLMTVREVRNLTEEESKSNEEHMSHKELCKENFIFDQELSKANGNFLCVSFDLQKVLNTPHSSNMNLYYSRKHSTYNLTVYESGTSNAHCFLWDETNGQRGSNEIVSCMHNYLVKIDQLGKYKALSLFCDSCGGQNKNKAMLGMIYQTLLTELTNIREIKLTFLIPGHTYMPVDSIHATIEHYVKNKVVWGPSEWSTLIRNTRLHPKPIEITELTYKDFSDWKSFSKIIFPINLKSSTGELIQISNIKSVLFEKHDTVVTINVFKSYSADEIPVKLHTKKNKSKNNIAPEQCYQNNLKISKPKYEDLLKLCKDGVIPEKYHLEYYQMNQDENVEDNLAETDDDEEVEENED